MTGFNYDMGAVYKLIGNKDRLVYIGFNDTHFMFQSYENETIFHFPLGRQHPWIYKAVRQVL